MTMTITLTMMTRALNAPTQRWVTCLQLAAVPQGVQLHCRAPVLVARQSNQQILTAQNVLLTLTQQRQSGWR